MAEQPRPDDLAQLRARLDIQEAEIARLKRRRRIPRRFLPLALVALLVALIPLASLAAGPTFNDLNGGSVHNPNIQLIADAGITKGCDPGVSYCPNGLVTREEMASFLARTAGLGSNPPVANAQTAQTAANATNATHATSADTATNATNAAQLGGKPAGAYLPATGDTIFRYSGATALLGTTSGVTSALNNYGGRNFTTTASSGSATIVVPLPRPTAQFGAFLAVKSLRVCFVTGAADIYITSTELYANERGAVAETTLILDPTDRTSVNAHTCYDLATTAAPQALAGQDYLLLALQSVAANQSLTLDSVALTLTPLGAGAAEVPPPADPNAPAKP